MVVRTVDEVLSLEQALVENLHREDLNPLEEAAAYQQLIEDFGLTQEQVAQKVGKSRSSVANTLRLFQLPPSIQRLVAENQLAAGHAKALLGTPDRAFQEALAKRIVADGLSVREAEEAVRLHGARTRRPSRPPAAARRTARPEPKRLRPPGLLELEELLADHLATRVGVSMGAGNGRGKIVDRVRRPRGPRADLPDDDRGRAPTPGAPERPGGTRLPDARSVVEGWGRQHEVDVVHNLCGTLWRTVAERGIASTAGDRGVQVDAATSAALHPRPSVTTR